MSFLWGMLGIVVLAVIGLYVRNLLPAYLDLSSDELHEHVEGLYYYGYDGGWISIWPKKTKRQLFVVRKRIEGKARISLHVEYPVEPWPEALRGRIGEFVEKRSLEHRRIQRDPQLRVEQVDCGNDVQACAELCRYIAAELAKAFGVPLRFVLDFGQVNQRGEVIGF